MALLEGKSVCIPLTPYLRACIVYVRPSDALYLLNDVYVWALFILSNPTLGCSAELRLLLDVVRNYGNLGRCYQMCGVVVYLVFCALVCGARQIYWMANILINPTKKRLNYVYLKGACGLVCGFVWLGYRRLLVLIAII